MNPELKKVAKGQRVGPNEQSTLLYRCKTRDLALMGLIRWEPYLFFSWLKTESNFFLFLLIEFLQIIWHFSVAFALVLFILFVVITVVCGRRRHCSKTFCCLQMADFRLGADVEKFCGC